MSGARVKPKPTGKLKFAYESIKNLEIKMEGLETQNIELMARCEELATALIGVMIIIENNCKAQKLKTGFINAIEVLNQTPQQSLNEIKAQAIEEGVKECMGTNDDVMVKAKANQMTHYANKLRGEK